MSTKKPKVGQLAFRGQIRNAVKKVIAGNASIARWLNTHGDWPTVLLPKNQLIQLQGIAANLDLALVARVLPAPPV